MTSCRETFASRTGRCSEAESLGCKVARMSTDLTFPDPAAVIAVPAQAIDQVRAVLRAVAGGEPVDSPFAEAEAAYALAALPPATRL